MLFPEGEERGRGGNGGGMWRCGCVGGGAGGGSVQPRVSPVSMCQPVSLFVHVTDTHVGTYQPQVAPINGRPTALSVVRRARPGDKIWSGICLSGDTRKGF